MNKNGMELTFQTIAVLILMILVIVVLIIAYRTQLNNLLEIFKGFF